MITFHCTDGWLHADLGQPHRFASSAVLGGGCKNARHWINLQVYPRDKHLTDPVPALRREVRRRGLTGGVVGMMTGATVRRYQKVRLKKKGVEVVVACTAGLKNGLMIGAPATYMETVGTINLLVWTNQPLTDAALVETLALAAHARTVAVLEHTGGAMSGTGTDAIAVACPIAKDKGRWAGMHTVIGELVGRATVKVVANVLRDWERQQDDGF